MAENVIIGGGVYGAAVAFELASKGQGCHLIEGKHVGAGASAGPGRRGVRASGRDPRELPLIREARNLWPGLHETLNSELLWQETGHLLAIERERELPEAEARAALQDRMGLPSRMLNATELRDLEPHISDSAIAAIWCPGDGVADHTATTKAYAEAARAAGVTIVEATMASRVITSNHRAIAVETSAGDRIAVTGNVFVLANAGVAELLAEFVALPVWNRAFQVLVSEPLTRQPVQHLVGHAHRTLSLKSEAGNRLMISGGRQGCWDPVTSIGTAIDDEIVANVADAVALYPSLDGIEIETADANHLESVSVDHVPIIDRVPGIENAYFATGWCGHGWAIAPAVARKIADWCTDGRRSALLKPFSLDRFACAWA